MTLLWQRNDGHTFIYLRTITILLLTNTAWLPNTKKHYSTMYMQSNVCTCILKCMIHNYKTPKNKQVDK